MSLQKKLRAAAVSAATEAVQIERGRCLWLLDCMMKAVATSVEEKLMSETQRHYANAKWAMVKAIVGQVRREIISGLRPPTPFHELREPVNDAGEMQTRCADLLNLLGRLGWGENSTMTAVKNQIDEWERQEDKIEELEDKIQELENEIQMENGAQT